EQSILNEMIDESSDNIDYLETSIKCVELYQWLSRHFANKNFVFDESELLANKTKAIERLNALLSDKIGKTCSSCGCKMPANARFNICDECFANRSYQRRPSRFDRSKEGEKGDRPRGGRDQRSFSKDRPRPGKQNGRAARPGSRPGGAPKRGKSGDAAKAFRK